ncbi:type II toxin-antitoxin system RelE/ParE family toxin [Pontibaca methylaminivorans]|uniref:ParE toxin of type II toxin-antitoxin system, parDE n=1 Tax=Pontibaca methylaminivorans TaxID=515897 RepID=A0A1R3X8L0_9RHOB|nr:type II toxin-antitoxin system RelE/ParE family toxin [Pontibaca methylaminivorans]SIT87062.1 ParE toxin of type II toxin-antitoxin system, parDE [Pontibaca methylaminivorans]
MRLIRHPLVARDLTALIEHIRDVTGDPAAAERRLDEIEAMLRDIAGNPYSGTRLAAPLDGWLVRHGGRGHRLTIVFQVDAERDALYIALVAFGGQDWMTMGLQRRKFGG